MRKKMQFLVCFLMLVSVVFLFIRWLQGDKAKGGVDFVGLSGESTNVLGQKSADSGFEAVAPKLNPQAECVDFQQQSIVSASKEEDENPPAFELPGKWTGATVLEYREPDAPVHLYVREYIVKPADLVQAYRVRETFKADEQGPWVLIETEEYVADHVLVKIDSKNDVDRFRAEVESLGGSIRKDLRDGLFLVQTPDVSLDALPLMRAQIENLGLCEFTEPDYLRSPNRIPNDTYYSSLWGMEQIDAPQAWAIRTDARSVIVGVVDSGVHYTHEDLSGNMWVNPDEIAGNGIDDDNNGVVDDIYGLNAVADDYVTPHPELPFDDDGHGTHCAGTIGAVGNNGVGVAGAAWNVNIMALKIGHRYGLSSSAEIEAFNYAMDKDVDILSCSFGGTTYSSSEYLKLAALRSAGIVVIAAAGNEEEDNDAKAHYPSSYSLDNIVAVAASDTSDDLAGFSNYGATSVDIAAPGVAIMSTYPFDQNNEYSDSQYISMNGTSMATPLVAGCLAILKAQYPGDSYLQLIERLYEGGDAISSLSGKIKTGKRVNLYGALRATPAVFAPTGVAASDGTYADKVRITWDQSSGLYYRVCRANSSSETKTALGSWQASAQYDDTTAVAGTTYYYWVQAATSSIGATPSAYSLYNTGWRQAASASYPDSWDPGDNTASGATSLSVTTMVQTHGPHGLADNDEYDCFKAYLAAGRSYTFESTGSSDVYGELYNSTSFSTTTRVAYNDDSGDGRNFKVTYTPTSSGYYYLRVRAYTVGSRATYTLKYSIENASSPVTVPASVSATDGTYADKVRITWSGTSGNYYQIYRATSSIGTKTPLNPTWVSATQFDDYTAIAGTTYYYWVKAATSSSGANASAYSAYNSGYRQASSLPDLLPSRLQEWDDKIVISTVTGTTASASTFLTTDTLYLDMATLNDSSVDIANSFTSRALLIDDVLMGRFSGSSLLGGNFSYYLDYNIGTLSVGTHEIKMVVDPDNEVAESDETNNEYTRTITVEEPATGLSSLSISGPSSVNEGASASFTCTAHYQNGTSAEVTASADWSVNSSYAAIANGILTAGSIPSDQAVSISASFTAGTVTVSNSKGVAINKLEAPVTVDHLSFAQRPGTKLVDITFDLLGDAGASADISVEVKNGATVLSSVSFSGDIGDDIAVGTGKSIVWNMAADWDGEWSTNIEISVTASSGVAGPVILFSEMFETTTFSTVNWVSVSDAVIDTLGMSEPSAPYSVRLNGNPSGGDELRSVVIDLSGTANATLSYYYQRTGGGDSTESGDDLVIEYKNAFGSWVELDRQLGSESDMTTYAQQTITLPAAALHSAFQFRFTNVGTSSSTSYYDDWFVDDIEIVANGSGSNLGGTVLFSDDFEDGDYAGWVTESGSYTRQVTDSVAANSSSRSLSLIGGANAHYNGVSKTFAGITPDRVEFYVRSASTTAADAYFVLKNDSEWVVFFYAKGDSQMGVYDGDVFHAAPYVANQWYKITFLFNWTEQTLDYYRDDALVASNIPFRESGASLTRLDLYNFNDSQAWWDEISMVSTSRSDADFAACELATCSGTGGSGVEGSVVKHSLIDDADLQQLFSDSGAEPSILQNSVSTASFPGSLSFSASEGTQSTSVDFSTLSTWRFNGNSKPSWVSWGLYGNNTIILGSGTSTLTASGVHELRFTVDANNDSSPRSHTFIIEEPSGATSQITIVQEGTSSSNAIDLRSYQPSGWDDKIVVRTTDMPETTYERGVSAISFSADDELYISFGSANFGDDAATAFDVEVYVDGTLNKTARDDGADPSSFSWWGDISIGQLAAGTHTIRIVIDASSEISETDETNNEYSRTITILPANGPTTPTSTSTATTDGSLDSRDYLLTVSSDHGSPLPSMGTHIYCWHSTVSCSVDASVTEAGRVYHSTGWSGTGSVPASGNDHITPSITLTTPSSSIAWLWEEEVMYALTVENGSGSGSYSAGESVLISANAAPTGQVFAAWTGDVAYVDDADSSTATVTMPEQDITLTATYQNVVAPDPFGEPSIYPTLPMNILASVTLFDEPALDDDVLAVYCGEELRGKAKVVVVNGVAMANVSVYTAMDGETLTFKVWDARNSEVYESADTTQSEVGGVLGSYPDDLFPIHVYADPFGTVEVYPVTPMSIRASVELFGEPAAEGDVVAVYHVDELRGKGAVVLVNGVAMVNLDVFSATDGESLIFKVWDDSEKAVLEVPYTVAQSVVGGSLGSYPDALFPIVVTDDLRLSLNLNEGWNQVSLNLQLDDSSPRSVFAPILSSVDRIVSVSHGSFDPVLPDMLNGLPALIPGEGYWVKMLSDQTLELSAPPVDLAEISIALSAGWNHMGYLPAQAGSIREVLSEVIENGEIVRITGREGVFNPNNPDSFNTLTILRPGLGYWVKTTGNVSFYFNEPGTGQTAGAWKSVDPFGTVVESPNPQMTLFANVKINDAPVGLGDVLAAFVGDELRAKSVVTMLNSETLAALAIHVKQTGEAVTFKLWDMSKNQVVDFPESSVLTESGEEPYPLNNPLILNVQTSMGERDSDNDGMPDWWETQYFGDPTNSVSSALCSNGINTLLECYVAGLDPSDPEACFKAVPEFNTNGFVFSWNTQSGRVYSIWQTTNLLDGFQCLETNLPWTVSNYVDRSDASVGCFKVEVQLAP